MLWQDAFRKSPFDTICTLLRVSGLQDQNWDTLEESEKAFEDFNWYLKADDPKLSEKAPWRIGLLMYCHAVEMSGVHATLANLLRIQLGKKYHLNPLGYLGRPHKKEFFKYTPPSATTKWKHLKLLAEEAGRKDLLRIIDAVFDDAVRNAFSHSDYIITEKYFRWTEGGLPAQKELDQVNDLIASAFSFFGIFMGMRDRWLELTAEMPRFHRWPQYEVLELLVNEKRRLCGFKVHFSNGVNAQFLRNEAGVDCSNITIEPDGTINFFVGPLYMRQKLWMVNGVPVNFGDRSAVNSFD